MSDFESGLATQVRFLPGERSCRSAHATALCRLACEGGFCAHRGAQEGSLADRLDAVRAAELAAGVTHPSCAFRGCTSPATGRLRGVGLCACHEMAARQREVAA